ncbi:hypothetical protein QP405_05885 [Gleimia europaea]|uniref:VG15 protein n=1 Tax=Gleimia europaea TaxID=66228 RepID=UPI002657D14E|nr:hypothetical protein [Gleimia europaea]MDK7143389.1 hypothetical protein [Gleimia europaea]
MRVQAPGSPLDAYLQAVDSTVQWLLTRLRRLFASGVSASGLPAALLPVVSEAYLRAWRAAAVFLVDEAEYRGVDGLVLVPSMTVPREDNLAYMLRHLGVPGVEAGKQPVTDFKVTPESSARVASTLVKEVRNVANSTVRRAAAGDPGYGLAGGKLSAALVERYREAGLRSQADQLEGLLRQANGVLEIEVVDSSTSRGVEGDAPSGRVRGSGRRDRGVVDKQGRPASRVKVKRPVAWARVIRGEYTCGFCIMLASRGAAYRNADTAGFESHYHCDCGVVPVYDRNNWTGMRQADYLLKLWSKHSGGSPTTFTTWARRQQEKGHDFRHSSFSPARPVVKKSEQL